MRDRSEVIDTGQRAIPVPPSIRYLRRLANLANAPIAK